jgi:CopG antitoxin of type II toxin-antitoxin system
MKASDFDAAFEAGEDMTDHLDLTSLKRPSLAIKRVNVDFPQWVVEALDKQARHLGVTRQSLIKMWIAERVSG